MSGLPREAPCIAPASSDVHDGVNICPLTTDEVLMRLRNESLMFPTWTVPSYRSSLASFLSYSALFVSFSLSLPLLLSLSPCLLLLCLAAILASLCSVGVLWSTCFQGKPTRITSSRTFCSHSSSPTLASTSPTGVPSFLTYTLALNLCACTMSQNKLTKSLREVFVIICFRYTYVKAFHFRINKFPLMLTCHLWKEVYSD